jgi:hypothetical protein
VLKGFSGGLSTLDGLLANGLLSQPAALETFHNVSATIGRRHTGVNRWGPHERTAPRTAARRACSYGLRVYDDDRPRRAGHAERADPAG